MSDSLDSEQGKKSEEKYLPSRELKDMSESEQDKYWTDGLDPQEVLKVQEELTKSKVAQLRGGIPDDKMGEALAEEMKGGSADPPITMPPGMSRSRCLEVWSLG